MVDAQGGDVAQIDDPRKLPQAKIRHKFHARASGWLAAVGADHIAKATLTLGAGRRTKADAIDHAVGIEVHCNVGDAVTAGDRLMTIHANDESALNAAVDELAHAVEYSPSPVEPLPLFHGVIDGRAL